MRDPGIEFAVNMHYFDFASQSPPDLLPVDLQKLGSTAVEEPRISSLQQSPCFCICQVFFFSYSLTKFKYQGSPVLFKPRVTWCLLVLSTAVRNPMVPHDVLS